ncbi:MAG: ATP-binding protein [Eubacterium sp.]
MQLLNEQFSFLYSDYDKTQLKNNRIHLMRQKEIREKIPAYRKLEDEMRDMSVLTARAALEGSRDSIAKLSEKANQISSQKKALLLQYGYAEDYLDPIYTCPDCRDTGYIDDKKCHCFQKRIVEYLYEQSNLKEVLDIENFSHFDVTYYPDDYIEESTGLTPRDNIRRILMTAHDFCDNFGNGDQNLLLYGNTGVGKTFLTHCIAKQLLSQSYTVVYLTSIGLFDILEKNKFDRELSSLEKSTTVSYIMNCDLLILDDLGTELTNSFTTSQLYQVIDSRLVHKKSTIISTNLSFDDLREQYSERIFSRLTSGYTLLKVTGEDIRLKKVIKARQS